MFAHDSSSNVALLFIWNPYPSFLIKLGCQHGRTVTPSEDVEEPIWERVSRLFIIREGLESSEGRQPVQWWVLRLWLGQGSTVTEGSLELFPVRFCSRTQSFSDR